jgi:acetyltransferase-like isoleucine patch superfamily enzyme
MAGNTLKTSICSLFASVSGNLTCKKFNPPVYIQNEANTKYREIGSVSLGSLGNTGSQDVVVVVRAVVSLVDRGAVTGDSVTTNASVTYNTGSLWLGHITSTVDSVNSYPSSVR